MSTSAVDVFEDGSGIELIRFDSDLNTVSNGALTVDAGTLDFKDGEYGKAVDAIEVKLGGMDSFAFTGDTHNPASFTFWVKRAVKDGSNVYDLFGFHDDNFGGWLVRYSYNDEKLEIKNGIYDRSFDIDDDDWHHFAVVWDVVVSEGEEGEGRGASSNSDENPRINFYMDGSLEYSDTGDGLYDRGSPYSDGTHIFFIGVGYARTEAFYFDQIRFFNRDLTSSEVTQLTNETEPVSTFAFKQLSSLGAYPGKKFSQGSSIESAFTFLFSQKESIEESTTASFVQQESIAAFIYEMFFQKSTLLDIGDDNFRQISKVHDYQPYAKKDTVCDIFAGSPSPILLSRFEGTLDAGCDYGEYSVELDRPVSYASGVNGYGVVASETIYLQFVDYTTDSLALGIWILSASGEEVLYWKISSNIYVKAGLTQDNRLFIKMTDQYDNIYIGYEGTKDVSNIPMHVLININAGQVRFLVNNILVMDGARAIANASFFDVIYGRIKNDGVVDQVRVFDGGLTSYQERAVYYDALSGAYFSQKSLIAPYGTNGNVIFSQKSNVNASAIEKFRQSSYLMQGKKWKFYQGSSLPYWKNKTVFRQIETIVEDPRPVIIGRVN